MKSISLDQYLNTHISQDNESFEDVLEVTVSKHRKKYKDLYGNEDGSEENQQKMLALPPMAQQAVITQKPLNVDTWGYKNKNSLMYNLDGVELTKEQETDLMKNKHKINHENTILKINPFNEVKSTETITELAKPQLKVLDGKVGVEGKELLKPETLQILGFSLVRTPFPSPSILGTPLMTWGEIEGTPFRLDGSETPLPRCQPPRREQIALALAEKVAEKNRTKRREQWKLKDINLARPFLDRTHRQWTD